MNCIVEMAGSMPTCTRCGAEFPSAVGRTVFSVCAKPGLGDVVAAVTSAVGIKPCGGCKERQAKLNKVGAKIGL